MTKIFRDGAGSQWDAQVVETFLGIQDEIRSIAEQDRAQPAHVGTDTLPIAVSAPSSLAALPVAAF